MKHFCGSRLGNHATTLVGEGTSSYLVDATNDTIFLVDDRKQIYQDNHYFLLAGRRQNVLLNFGLSFLKSDVFSHLQATNLDKLEKMYYDYYQVMRDCFALDGYFETFCCQYLELYHDVISKKRVLGEKSKGIFQER